MKLNYLWILMKDYSHSEKFENIRLYPACYGGLLSCNYFIKFVFDINSWLTTNEEIIIPLDFYERFTGCMNTPKNFEENQNIIISDIQGNDKINNIIKIEDEPINDSEIKIPKDNFKKVEEEFPNESEINTPNFE